MTTFSKVASNKLKGKYATDKSIPDFAELNFNTNNSLLIIDESSMINLMDTVSDLLTEFATDTAFQLLNRGAFSTIVLIGD